MQSKVVRLIAGLRILSVSDGSDSINERTHTDQQQNKITYSMGVPEVPMNKLGNWLMVQLASSAN